jgi:hypothetical protein
LFVVVLGLVVENIGLAVVLPVVLTVVVTVFVVDFEKLKKLKI